MGRKDKKYLSSLASDAPILSIYVTEVFFWIDDVSYPLLEFFRVGEASVPLALPYHFVIYTDFKLSACIRAKSDLAKLISKSRKKLLRHPCGTQKPITLRAVVNRNAGQRHKCVFQFLSAQYHQSE